MEQTRKYNSSAFRRNKFLLPVLFCCAFGFSQDASVHVQKTLMNAFSAPALDAYKENSLQKVTDFYYYLNLLSANKDADLEAQLKENIFSLFEDRNVVINDFTTDKKDQIPLSYLLENIASKEIVFSVKNEQVKKMTYENYWFGSYTLEVTKNGKSALFRLHQKIFLKTEEKNFGNESKQVWQTSLGGIE